MSWGVSAALSGADAGGDFGDEVGSDVDGEAVGEPGEGFVFAFGVVVELGGGEADMVEGGLFFADVCVDGGAVGLEVVLEGVGPHAGFEGLVLAGLRSCEVDGARGELGDFLLVRLELW